MAQLISVKLSRFDGSPWGFRLQGGKDFGTPLIVQKINVIISEKELILMTDGGFKLMPRSRIQSFGFDAKKSPRKQHLLQGVKKVIRLVLSMMQA
ncbi:hypothetical protein EAI_07707 [Harpegnathos saltator]|uniref:Uncharacterized protein n=1 Tax=Harpegnathos saltator TaxID=610380 RepID=E2B4Z6_HARSA|nr:hypothetical protein EAI_07707 [Harpegnathos saltator]